MRGFGCFLAFVGGAVIGAVLTDFWWKEKNREEVEQVRNELKSYYKDKLTEETEKVADESIEEIERLKTEINSKTDQLRISTERLMTQTEKEIETATKYIIRPDEYGEKPNYGRFRYTYYPDNDIYVNSDYDVPVEEEEVLDMIGPGIPDHFGEIEDDVVYVRNDELKTDVAVYLAEGSFEG